MSSTAPEELINGFRQYLENLTRPLPEEPPPTTDLYSLFSELEVLRNEVKTESRLVGSAFEQFRDGLDMLRGSQSQLERELERSRAEAAQMRKTLLRPLLLEWLDLHDRLTAGQNSLQNYRPIKGWFWRTLSRKEDRQFINGIRDGQAMTLRRLEESLIRQQVKPLEVLGQIVDPHTMTVVELDHKPELENGMVTQELRKGFLWGHDVLRLAEVKANKI
ncbi:MAG: nucleotide exchange factor GrpE [Methylococcaceae bacterium]